MPTDVDDRLIDWRAEDASHDHASLSGPCSEDLHELCDTVTCECGCHDDEVAW